MPHSETFIDGVWFPSVTTITGREEKPWLVAWREKWGLLAERKTKIASAVGTEFHRCVDAYLSTGTYSAANAVLDESPLIGTATRVAGMMKSFVDWAQTVEGEIHETELKVISREHTYSGTLDAVGTFNGKPMLYDWKTSSRIYDDMDLQLVAYARAYKEQTGVELKQGMIVQVSKDKPHFKLTTRVFKLGKRPWNKFLKLREKFGPFNKTETE